MRRIKRKCRLEERIKSHQVGVKRKCRLGRESNPIRLVCRRKCKLGERIKSHQVGQVGVQKKM